MTNTVSILQAMKDALMERGWCQRSFQEEDGAVCLMASFTRTGVYDQLNMNGDDVDRIMTAIRNEAGMNVIDWNDKPGRTFNEVIALLDDVILSEKLKND